MRTPERQHPADDRLIALYFGDEEVSAEDRRGVRQHLHGCETCTWRYTELTAPLQQLRQDAASEADEVFTPARLDAQRAAIRQRLEDGVRPPRVIPFPTALAHTGYSVSKRPVARWIAAAAAAGLLIGIGAGRFVDRSSTTTAVHVSSAGPRLTATSRPAPREAELIVDEENFLTQVDEALYRPQRVDELRALDELTPHARQVVAQR